MKSVPVRDIFWEVGDIGDVLEVMWRGLVKFSSPRKERNLPEERGRLDDHFDESNARRVFLEFTQ
jgi:hypothetical protein